MLDCTCSYYNYYLSLCSRNSNIVTSNTPLTLKFIIPNLGGAHMGCVPLTFAPEHPVKKNRLLQVKVCRGCNKMNKGAL